MQHGKKMHVAQMPPLTLVASGKCLVSAFDYRWSSSVAAAMLCLCKLSGLPIIRNNKTDKCAFNELTIKVCVCCS